MIDLDGHRDCECSKPVASIIGYLMAIGFALTVLYEIAFIFGPW